DARTRRLQNGRGVDPAFLRSGANQRVQLVNTDDVLRIVDQLAHNLFRALFELAAIFCAGNNQTSVEREDAFVFQKRWNFVVNNSLGQTFDDGSFANARFTDQHRIIFRAATKNLDHSFDLAIASN